MDLLRNSGFVCMVKYRVIAEIYFFKIEKMF